MATYTKMLLSGSTNGLYVNVANTASPGSTIHTAVSGTSSLDEIWIYATNDYTLDAVLTIEWGGVHDGGMTNGPGILMTIPAKSGPILVIPGLLLQNSLVIKAYTAGGSNVVRLYGYVHRITA